VVREDVAAVAADRHPHRRVANVQVPVHSRTQKQCILVCAYCACAFSIDSRGDKHRDEVHKVEMKL
jgi:hypothetical protein